MTTDAEPVNAAVAAMALAEARRLLESQQAALEALRARAITLVSVASVVAGIFASRIPKKLPDYAGWSIGVALFCFGVSVVLTLVILAPGRFDFGHSLNPILTKLSDGIEMTERDVAYTWADGFEDCRRSNEPKIQRRMTCFQWACFLLGAQVVAWGVTAVL